jgi:hypothetical protein
MKGITGRQMISPVNLKRRLQMFTQTILSTSRVTLHWLRRALRPVETLKLHDRFERTSFPLQTSMMSNACRVWGEILSWCVHCKTLLSGRVQAPQALQRSNPYDKLARSTVSNACLVWGEILWRYYGHVSHAIEMPVRHLVVDLCVTSRAFMWR